MLIRRNGIAARTLGLVPLRISPFLLLPAREGLDTETFIELTRNPDMQTKTITLRIPVISLPKIALPKVDLPFTIKIERKAKPKARRAKAKA